jgi:hypothetical protein
VIITIVLSKKVMMVIMHHKMLVFHVSEMWLPKKKSSDNVLAMHNCSLILLKSISKALSFSITNTRLKIFSTNDLQITLQCSNNQLGFKAMIISCMKFGRMERKTMMMNGMEGGSRKQHNFMGTFS